MKESGKYTVVSAVVTDVIFEEFPTWGTLLADKLLQNTSAEQNIRNSTNYKKVLDYIISSIGLVV